jgi:hypothetical protein
MIIMTMMTMQGMQYTLALRRGVFPSWCMGEGGSLVVSPWGV